MTITDLVLVHMTAQGMGNAASAWRITGIMMRAYPGVSFRKKPRLPMTEALRPFAVIRELFKGNMYEGVIYPEIFAAAYK